MSILPLFALSQKRAELNYMDTNMLKQGPWKKNHPNGKLRYEGQFKDDKPYGIFIHYYESGKKKSNTFYFENGKRARTKIFEENGRLKSEGNFLNEKKDSVWKFYDEYEKLSSEENYIDGVLNGKSILYYPDGKSVQKESYYKDAKLHGEQKQFFKSGKLMNKCNYDMGVLNGFYLVNYENELPYCSGNYKADIKEGWWSFYNKDGTVNNKKLYIGKKEKQVVPVNGKFEEFYGNEIPKSFYTYKDGKRHGAFQTFYNKGSWVTEMRENPDSGEKEPVQKLMGQILESEGSYVDDKLDGVITYYDDKGKVKKKVKYSLGKEIK